MTVAEYIELLKQLPQDLPVYRCNYLGFCEAEYILVKYGATIEQGPLAVVNPEFPDVLGKYSDGKPVPGTDRFVVL